MSRWRTQGAWAGLVIVLAAINVAIVHKERVLTRGSVVLLELAPVDPRSLMQGDYMRLDYEVARALDRVGGADALPADGRVVVRPDPDGVARFVRVASAGERPGAGEHVLRYRRRDGALRVGPGAYFFQEGQSERYAGARFGELRVDDDGDAVLVGLRDQQLRPL